MSWKKGEAPWEKSQQQSQPSSFKKGQAPWEQNSIKDGEISQEMPDWLSSKDRLIAKNFAQSVEKQAEFLRQKYPEAKVVVKDGNVLLKGKNDQYWKTLDPDTGFFSKDMLNDAGDIAYDTIGSVGQGIATTLGAAGGTLAGGAGALPGAALASGASSAAIEALRQKIGQQLDIPQDVSGKDVATSGALGLASTLMFGAGPQTRGLVQKGWDVAKGVGRKTAAFSSGMPEDVISYYGKNMDRVDDLKNTGVYDKLLNISNNIESNLDGKTVQIGKQLRQTVDDANIPVDIQKAKGAFLDRIKYLESKPDLTNAELAEIGSLKGAYKKYFGVPNTDNLDNLILSPNSKTEIPDALTASRSFDLQQKLKQAAAFEQNMTPETQAVKNSARGAYGALNDSLDIATDGASPELKTQYKTALNNYNEMARPFGFDAPTDLDRAQKTLNTIGGLDKKSKALIKERLKTVGIENVQDDMDLIRAHNYLNMPSQVGMEKVPLAAGVGSLGGWAGYKTAGMPGGAVGFLAGTYTGNKLASPEMVKTGVKAVSNFEKLAAEHPELFYLLPNQSAQSIWKNMGGE